MSDALPQDFDWLVPTTKELLRPDEVARYLGRSPDFVEQMIDEGRLEYLSPADRQVERKVITRRSLILLIAEQFRGDPARWMERVEALLNHMDAAQLTRVITAAQARLSKKRATPRP